MKKEVTNQWVLLLLVFFISALFLSMIRQFLMTIFLAGLFSALAHPLYRRFERWYGQRRTWASLSTLAVLLIVVILPVAALVGIVTSQAIKVGETIKPWVQHHLSQPDAISTIIKSLPFINDIEPYRNLILEKAGQIVGLVSDFLINRLRAATLGTANFLFMLFLMLYTMFFFLMDGHRLINKILYYLPLTDRDERRMLDKFTSVTRATLKGTAVIGVLQGGLAGLAFALVGIHSAVFWGTIMAVLSFIPGIGSALVWGPAVVILAASGNFIKAIGLGAFCVAVVGSIDNLLRPVLVGKDTQLHELLILFGTLGGILMFGVVGVFIGPIIAALFVTVWEIYGMVFKEVLPNVGQTASETSEQANSRNSQSASIFSPKDHGASKKE
ncbi:MAG: AI-2E family transporter [Deltaproteobacteria bacterium]